MTQSMGAIGSRADNALTESFNATLKREALMDARSCDDELTCRRQTFRLDCWAFFGQCSFVFQAAFVKFRSSRSTSFGVRYPRAE